MKTIIDVKLNRDSQHSQVGDGWITHKLDDEKEQVFLFEVRVGADV